MSGLLEVWGNFSIVDRGDPFVFIERARMLEAEGWDGATSPDSQSLMVEAYVILTACVQATKRLKFGPGVTNPSTRHPAITAATMLTLQALSKGRMVLGIGRGDASLAYLGGSPVSVKEFEAALQMIHTYMRGEAVPIELAATALARNSGEGFGELALHHAPEGSKLKWVTAKHSRPPVDVFCTGPKVIGVAARQADYISFALGADVGRLKWAIGIAKEELERAGRDPASVVFGAHIPAYPHEDIEVSRALAEGYVTAQARFGVMNNKVVGPASEKQRENLERLASKYDMQNHGAAGSAQAKALDADFVDAFGLTGRPEKCIERLQEIRSLGIGRLQLAIAETETERGRESYRLAADVILPALRRS